MAANAYTVSGTDSDTKGDTGTWSFVLTVTAVTLTQGTPTTGSVTTTSSAAYTNQLTVAPNNGAVTFVTTVPSGSVTVSGTGGVTTTGTLAANTYTVSGTDHDTKGDTGTWSFALTVTAVPIIQGTPTSGTVTTTASNAYTNQLTVAPNNGAVTFVTTVPSGSVSVSASGAVTTAREPWPPLPTQCRAPTATPRETTGNLDVHSDSHRRRPRSGQPHDGHSRQWGRL